MIDCNSALSTAEIVARYLRDLALWGPYSYMVQGGYFDMPDGPTSFSLETLRAASSLVTMLRNIPGASPRQSLLINDLGMNCEQGACEMRLSTNPDLLATDVASQFLCESGFGDREVQWITERRVRNRGLRRLKKILAGKSMASSQIRFTRDDGCQSCLLDIKGGQSLQLFTERGTSLIAKCPLIMGSGYHLMALDAVPNAERIENDSMIVVVDFCTYSERDRVASGAKVFSELFSSDFTKPVVIVTVCCDHNGQTPIIFAYGDTPWELGRRA